MKLIIAVVQDQDVDRLIDVLMEKGYRATKLASTGGFLKAGNTTLLIAVDDNQADDVVDIVKDVCKSRTQVVAPLTAVGRSMNNYVPSPIEVPVGGAAIFVVNVERFEKA
ncbi:MAG: cyclic-di-AMP receptor [Bacillota bacterium]